MFSRRNTLLELIEQQQLPRDQLDAAVAVANLNPDRAGWSRFMDQLLLVTGALSIAVSLVFFIAYNWERFGRYAKFALVEVLVVAAVAVFIKQGAYKLSGRVALLSASIFLGVLLALFGQTYQTGADPWQLFFYWALLILPWVVIARLAALWLFWLLLLNLAAQLYQLALGSPLERLFAADTSAFWLLVLLNAPAQIGWEWAARRWSFLSVRWPVRVLAVAAGAAVTALAVLALVADMQRHSAAAVGLWLVYLVTLVLVYRKRIPDLFMLAGMCLSGIIVITTFLGRHLLENNDAGAFFLLALLVIAMGSGSAIWLRKVHQAMPT